MIHEQDSPSSLYCNILFLLFSTFQCLHALPYLFYLQVIWFILCYTADLIKRFMGYYSVKTTAITTCNERSKEREITLSMHIVLHFPSIYCLLFRQSLFKASLGILIKILSCAIWTCILWFLCFSCTVFAYLIFSPSQLFKAFLL